MCDPYSVSICIPAYNEEKNIKQVIEEAFTVVNDLTPDHEVIVANDGSTDRTKTILNEAKIKYNKLIVINNEINFGIEPTLKTLFNNVSKEYIFFISADRQFHMESLYLMHKKVKENYDVVIGVKKNIKQVYTPYRLLISFFYNYSIFLFFGIRIRDAGGIKLAKSIIWKMPVYSNSVFGDAERIIRAHYAGCSIGIVGVNIKPRLYGKATGVKLNLIISSIKDLLKLFIMKRKMIAECKLLALQKK